MKVSIFIAAALTIVASASAQVSRFGKCIPEKGATARFTKFRGKSAEEVCQRLLGDCDALKSSNQTAISSCHKVQGSIVEAKCITTSRSDGSRLSQTRVLAKLQNLRAVYDFKPAAVGPDCFQFSPGLCSTKFYTADRPEKICKVTSTPNLAPTPAQEDKNKCPPKQRAISYFKTPGGSSSQPDVCETYMEKCAALGDGKERVMRIACAFSQDNDLIINGGCVEVSNGKTSTYARHVAHDMGLELVFPSKGKNCTSFSDRWCSKKEYDSSPYELCSAEK